MKKIQKSLCDLLPDIVPDNIDCMITGISNDSRRVKSGDLFIATVGDRYDARQDISTVINKAAAVFYEDDETFQFNQSSVVPVIAVSHLNHKQGEIAARFYDDPSKAMRCVGVTGTNGKTTCTQWIAQALTLLKTKCATIGTLGSGLFSEEHLERTDWVNTGYTTPDPILLQEELMRLRDANAVALAMEVSSHALAQERVNGMQFDVAVFTQLSRDHLDYHGDMPSYAAAKAKLFEMPNLRHAVINIDDALGRRLAEATSQRCDVLTYSLAGKEEADIRVDDVQETQQGFKVMLTTHVGSAQFDTKVLGHFNISNLLTVLGVLLVFDVALPDALRTIELLTPVDGRMQLVDDKVVPIVVVDYSHTPDALEKALSVLRERSAGQLWCVFGCGGDRDRGKRSNMAKVAETYSDRIVVTNDNPRTESPDRIVDDIMTGFLAPNKVKIILDRADAITYAIQTADKNDVVLIAGKGHENYQIIGNETLAFNDVKIARQILLQEQGN